MKNLNYFNLNQIKSNPDGQTTVKRQSRVMSQSGCSAVDVPMTSYGASDEHPMSIRSASDERRWNSRVWKYVAMIFAVLVMSIANIGMAWGTEYALVSNPTSSPSLTSNFYVGSLSLGSSTATIDGIAFKKAISLGSTLASINGKKAGEANIMYDVKTTSTTFTVYVGGATGTLYFSKIAEGATSTTVENKTISTNPQKLTFTLSSTTNTRVGFSVDNTSIKIYQIIAEETGTAHKQAGEAGYQLNLNKGRYAGSNSNSGKSGNIDNIELVHYNAYTCTNTTDLQLSKNTTDTYIKFTTGASAVKLKVTFSDGTLIVNTSKSTSGGTSLTSNTAQALAASTTYWIINTNSSNRAKISKIAFEAASGVTDPSFSPATGSSLVKSTGTVTLTSSGNTVYYKWSQTNNQYASGDGATLAGAADGSGSSPVNATAPSTTGTWYLYAVAKNGGDYSDVVKATYTITNPTHTLTWNLDGGTATGGTAAGAVEEGASLTAPTVTKVGYDFAGWSPTVPATMPAADATYIATWTKVYASGTYQFDGHLTVGTSPSYTVSATASDYAAKRADNIFFSATNIQFEGTDGTPQGDGDNYMGWKVKASTTIKFFVEDDSDVEVSIGSIGEGGTCTITYTDQSSVEHNNTSITAGSQPSYEVKAGTMVTISMAPSSKKSITLKRIAISGTSSCTGTYSFHSKNSSSTWEDPICFAQVGSSTTYMTDEVYLPTDGVSFKVGWEGSDDAARAKTSEKDWYYMIMGPRGSRGTGGYWIAGRHTTSENTGGAKGRFYLYSDNNEDNKYVGFTPTGYKLRFGKGESWTSYAFSPNEGATDEATDWRTGLVTLNSDNADYHTYVGLETSSDYVWTDHSEDDRHVFLDVTTNWGNDGVTNFAIYCWDGTGNDRWCLMTAVPGVTKLYEGWLPNTYNYLKFVRLKSSTCSFDNKYNTTGDLSLLDGKNLFTITDWETGSWGVYEKTGKFRMWANSTSQNWYLHFYPYNVLTYNANTGSGTMTPQSVAADAGSKNVTVLANGFTAPTGYQFDHWDTAPDGSGTDYAPGATYNLTADATLYAIWTPQTYSITYKDQGGADFSGSHADGYPTTHTYGTATTLKTASKTGYTFDGWYGNSECTGAPMTSILGTSYTGDFTLYAKWTVNTHTLTWDFDGGSSSETAGTHYTAGGSVNYGTSIEYPSNGSMSKAGYTFDGWSSTPSMMPDNDLTITAQWASACTPQTISKVVVTGASAGTTSGYNNKEYAGTAVVTVNTGSGNEQTANIDGVSGNETGYKMGSAGNSIVFATLNKGSFQAGDIIKIGITRRNDVRQVDSKYNILTIYYGTNKSDATALTTITTGGDNDNSASDSEGAGIYSYTLTAADVTAIGAKKGIGVFRESSNGLNAYIHSVEIYGCRDWTLDETAPTLVSSNPANGATGVATSGTIVLTFSEALGTVDASKFTLTGATKGAVSIDGSDATKVNIAYSGAANEATVTLETAAAAVSDLAGNALAAALSDISFTTEAADGCPTAASGEVVYKFVTKSSGLGTSAICANKDQDYPLSTGDGNPLETLTNGTLTARASTAGTTNLKYNKGSINFNGGSSGWLIIGLDCPIKSGDVIRYVNSNSGSVAIRTATGTSTNEIVLTGNSTTNIQTVVISAAQATAFNELTTVYMVRKSGTSDISYFEIIRPYVITLDANTNGGKVNGENTEVHYMLSGESLVLPHATKSGYRFKGWFTTSGGATQASTNYSPTGSTTLYAQFEDCPGSGTVYKWEVATELTNGSLPVGVSGEAEMEANEGNYLSTLIGGTLTLHNKNNHIKISDESKFSIDDNAPYIIVNLDCALEAGDKFVATVGSHTAYVTKTSTRASTVELPTGTKQKTAVPEALEGASTLYIWRGDGNYKISYFEITRTSTTYTVSYDANGGAGTAPTDGTAYARNTEVTVKDNTGSLSKSNYAALAYWNTKDDGTGTDYAVSTGTFEITADVTLYAKWTQTVTLDANTAYHGSTGGSATAVWNATGLTGITHATPVSGYKLLGYYTTASGAGVKVLNSDGTFAGSNVTDYITSGKWSRTDEAPTLYARYESSGALIWNLGVNTDATSLTTSSKNSEFAQIAGSNMTNAALTGISYSKSKKSELTGVIETPTSYDGAKYVSVTFQVAAGYKFTPSSVKVKVQPKDNAKTVKIELSDASSHSQNYTSDSQSAGSIHTVTMTGNGTFYTGTVTLKIYCYGASGGYRLGTPISIEGEVEATCTMPSFDGLNYEETSYNLDDDASAITVTNPANVTTYAWKQNTTNDRTGGESATGATNAASYTPPTGAAGTMYYWCELRNDCGTVKTPSVGITVSVSKSDATISWTGTSASANYGGGGYTVKATVNETEWNGNAEDLTLSAPAGIRIYNIVSGTAASKKYVQASFDVTTAFDRETYSSTIPFVVTADATATYNAISDEEDVTFDACTGGGGEGSAFVEVTSAVTTAKTGMSNYWEAVGVGRLNKAYNQAMGSSADAQTIEGHSFSYRTGANNSNWMVNPYIAGVTKIRLYFYASAAIASGKLGISKVLYDTEYFSSQGSRSVVYDNVATNADSYAAADKGWIEFTLPEMAANSYCYFSTNTGNLYVYGVELFSGSVGSGGSQTTNLTWSQDVDESDAKKVTKKTTDAYFTITANRADAVTRESLGAITYSSSVPSVATVDPSTGKVSMVAAGTTIIKATLAASGCFKKKEITYKLEVEEEECSIAAGTLTLTSGSETKCSSDKVTLKLTGFESGAGIQWKDGDTDIDDGGNYEIVSDGTTSTLTTDQPGTYSVIVTKGCFVRSNRITIKNASAEASVSKIIDEWYIKQGRLTPDIALFNAEGATSFTIEDASTDAEVTSIAGCTFELQDDVIYLHGYSTAGVGPTGIESAANETIKVVVTDACGNEASAGNIIIHKQIRTDKHVLAFVVNGTAKGGFTEGITADQTTNVGLYNAIAAQFDVQATNIYATDDEKKLKEYYSQYDILCITDYPNTKTKGVNSKSYVDAIGALIDIRPILTMEAFVSSLANWRAKGISGNPKSPTTRQYTMDLQCKDHEIFAQTDLTKVGEGDEAMYRVSMVDNTKEEYVSLDATYGGGAHAEKDGYNYGGKPALQGFTFTEEMANDLLPIGLIDDGADNPLQVGIERQRNMEARLMVLGINSYAMERLTNDGERVVINALNYLMKKNQEDIADCSTAFVGGAEGHEKNWDYADNWTGNTVPLPTQKVRILADCEVSSTVYAQSVLIVTDGEYNHGSDIAAGKLTIKENGALIVSGKIQAASAPAYNRPRATTPEDLKLYTNEDAQAALIFDNEEAETQATVYLYSLGRRPSSYQYQYFAVPMEVVPVNPTFANETHGGTGIYTYVYNEATSGWTRRGYYTDLLAFEGLGITTKSETAMNYTLTGNLASTATQEITLTHNGAGLNLIGNSWMAPIQIGALAEDNTDANITKTVYIYCAGRDAVKGAATSGETETAGQWLAVPFEAASFATWKEAGKLSVIPAMQAFEIKVSAEATLTLDYDKVVRGSTNDLNAKLRAPGRRMAANEVTMTNIRIADSKTHTDLSLFEGDRFSEAFDNGWEAEYMNGDGRSAKLYAETETGKMAVVAMEDYEGTVVGFAPGKETEYTFSFMGEDNGYYLNDIKLQNSVRISEGETYTFTYEEGDAANRFYISRTAINAPAVTTGMDEVREEAKPRKFIYNDKMYILFNGRVFDATGKAVK